MLWMLSLFLNLYNLYQEGDRFNKDQLSKQKIFWNGYIVFHVLCPNVTYKYFGWAIQIFKICPKGIILQFGNQAHKYLSLMFNTHTFCIRLLCSHEYVERVHVTEKTSMTYSRAESREHMIEKHAFCNPFM